MLSKNVPVQMIAHCGADGSMQPLRFRFEDAEHVLHTVRISEVLDSRRVEYVGIEAFLFVCKQFHLSRWTLFIFFLLATVSVAVKRWMLRRVLRRFREHGYNLKHVLLVGCGEQAPAYCRAVQADRTLGFCIDHYLAPRDCLPGISYLGTYDAIANVLDRQNPDAAVLSCSDSRVPPEIIFDAGLGDLFTIRTAGQIIDDAVLASLEYAVDHLHVSLLMVMGHEGCGAVALGAEQLDALIADSTSDPESSLESADAMAELDERIASSDSIVLRSVGMSVWQAREAELDTSEDFERVHVARTIEELVTRSEIIQDALAHDRLMIVGARYQLSTGKVEVLSF